MNKNSKKMSIMFLLHASIKLTKNWFSFSCLSWFSHHQVVNGDWLDLLSPRHMPLLGHTGAAHLCGDVGYIVEFETLQGLDEPNDM